MWVFRVLGFRLYGSQWLGFLDVVQCNFLDLGCRVSKCVCPKPILSLTSRILLLIHEGSMCLGDFDHGNDTLATFCHGSEPA